MGAFLTQGLDYKGLAPFLYGIPGFDTAIEAMERCETCWEALKSCLKLPRPCSDSLARKALKSVLSFRQSSMHTFELRGLWPLSVSTAASSACGRTGLNFLYSSVA